MPEGTVGPGAGSPGERQPAEAPNVMAGSPPQRQVSGSAGQQTAAEDRDGLQRQIEQKTAELDSLRARYQAAGGDTVRMRVKQPHAELHFGGVKLTNDFQPVPAHAAPGLAAAAADAGAEIEQET